MHRFQEWDLIEAIDCPKGRYLCEVERQIEEKWCCCSEIPALRVPFPASTFITFIKAPVTTLRGTPVPRQAPLNWGQQVAPLRLSAAPGRCSEAQLGGTCMVCVYRSTGSCEPLSCLVLRLSSSKSCQACQCQTLGSTRVSERNCQKTFSFAWCLQPEPQLMHKGGLGDIIHKKPTSPAVHFK